MASTGEEPMITGAELDAFIMESEIGAIPKIDDSQYSLPSADWVRGEFGEKLRETAFRLGYSYRLESEDCDDFSLLALWYARRSHGLRRKGTGLAFGEFNYTRRIGGAHAINLFVCRENGLLVARFYEPQLFREISLTTEEMQSCVFCRF
jgi:hypothetical protein